MFSFRNKIKKVIIDAGHGGSDPGTIANGIVEKEYTLKISQYIHERLDDLGVENTLTRNSDITLDSKKRPKIISDIYGNGEDVLVVSNHINAGGGDGAEIIYALRNSDSLSKMIAKEFENNGQNVRKYYQRRLPSDPSKDYYYIMRNTPNNETIIVEYGFADSSLDDVEFLKNNWQSLAEGVVKAICDYIGVKYELCNMKNFYIVKKGDTLWSIAKKFNINVDKLKDINNLTSNIISVGQKLLVDEMDDYIIYKVKKGDNLYKISKEYNVSINELKDLNNLESDILQISDELKIPSKRVYIVKKGDNLYKISKEFNTSVDEIMKLNKLTNYNLNIGKKLLLP